MKGWERGDGCQSSVSPKCEKASAGEAEVAVESTNVYKAKKLWQEKLDEAMARKEQERNLVSGSFMFRVSAPLVLFMHSTEKDLVSYGQ